MMNSRTTTDPYPGRSPFTPEPFMGLPPRWRVSDLTPSYSTPMVAVPATSVAVTSAAVNPQANGIEIYPQFSNGDTSCTLKVLNDDGTGTFNVVAEFDNVSLFNASGCAVGPWPQGISLGGRAVKIDISNIVGTGTVTVLLQRLN